MAGRMVVYELAAFAFWEPRLATAAHVTAARGGQPVSAALVSGHREHSGPPGRRARPGGGHAGRLTIATITRAGITVLPPQEIVPLPTTAEGDGAAPAPGRAPAEQAQQPHPFTWPHRSHHVHRRIPCPGHRRFGGRCHRVLRQWLRPAANRVRRSGGRRMLLRRALLLRHGAAGLPGRPRHLRCADRGNLLLVLPFPMPIASGRLPWETGEAGHLRLFFTALQQAHRGAAYTGRIAAGAMAGLCSDAYDVVNPVDLSQDPANPRPLIRTATMSPVWRCPSTAACCKRRRWCRPGRNKDRPDAVPGACAAAGPGWCKPVLDFRGRRRGEPDAIK